MTPLPHRALAEAIGTFLFCLVGVAAICTNTKVGGGSGLLGVAVAHGLALSVVITALGKVSGAHFNPAVTATMVVTRQMNARTGGVYVLSQLAGATLAGYLARAVFADGVYLQARGGVPVPTDDLSFMAAVVLEAVATFFLVFSIFGTAVDVKAPSVGGFGIGLTVACLILAIGPLTGASMNPARTFGPGLAAWEWSGHLIYWVGPVLGGVAAGFVYTRFFLTPVPPEKPVGSGID